MSAAQGWSELQNQIELSMFDMVAAHIPTGQQFPSPFHEFHLQRRASVPSKLAEVKVRSAGPPRGLDGVDKLSLEDRTGDWENWGGLVRTKYKHVCKGIS